MRICAAEILVLGAILGWLARRCRKKHTDD